MGTQSKGHMSDLPYLSLLFKVLDALLIYSSLFVLLLVFKNATWFPNYNSLALVTILIFLFAAESTNLYQSWRGIDFTVVIQRVSFAWAVSVLTLLIIGYLTKQTADFSRILVTSWFITVLFLLLLWRAVFRWVLNHYRRLGYNSRQVALVGINELSWQVVKYMKETPELGMHVEGLYDDRTVHRDNHPTDVAMEAIIGDSNSLIKKAKAGMIDLVYITLPMRADERIKELINKLSDTTVAVYMMPDLYTYELFNGAWTNMAGHPAISVFESPFKGFDAFVKRTQDIVLSIIILILISPILLVIAIAVKMTSSGSVLFKQHRYGISGEAIDILKFRSMTTQDNGDDIKQATQNDARVTPLGGFLRRTSLDELPQFFNVLIGDMSIVGPRPHAAAHNELYRKQIRGYMLRHAVKPGITGWAQINGWRGETDTLEKMQNRIDYDHWYIRHWSLWLDIRIIFLTIFKGFVARNAY